MTIDESIDILTYPTYYCSHLREKALDIAIETMHKYEYDHNKIEKIADILKTAKADPTRDEYAEYYLDAIEEVVRWTQI